MTLSFSRKKYNLYNEEKRKEFIFIMAKTWKQIETSRNRRLWIVEVLLPTLSLATVILANESAKNTIKRGFYSVKNKALKTIRKIKIKKDKGQQ